MKIESIIQKENVNTLKNEFLSNSNASLKKMYVFLGTLKETGFDILEECLIDNKSKKMICFAYDKKNTTKKMLDQILKYTKSVLVYNNNQKTELYSNIWIFEYEKKALVYLLSGNVSSSSLETDNHIYTKIEYDFTDTLQKKEYIKYVSNIEDNIKEEGFQKLDKDLVKSLLEDKQIFSTKQYVYNVPSLNDLINNGTIKKSGYSKIENEEDINETNNNSYIEDEALPHVELDDLNDISFDIDIEEVQSKELDQNSTEIKKVEKKYSKKNVNSKDIMPELDIDAGSDKEYVLPKEDSYIPEQTVEEFDDTVIDMEKEIFLNETVKIDKRKINSSVKKEKKEKEENINKKIDLSKVSNLIMELGNKPTKGKDVSLVKVPNYIKDILPEFFEALNKAKVKDIVGSKTKLANVNLEIIDVNENKKYMDKEANLLSRSGQTYIAFSSKILADINYDDGDIVRIIKLSKDSYHVEIIPKEIDEYEFWKKLCTQNFRGSTRTYGMM